MFFVCGMMGGKIAERRRLKEPTQLQWRVTLPSANILFCVREGCPVIVFLYFSDYLISLIESLVGLLNLNKEFPNHPAIFCYAECKIKNNDDKEIFFNVLNVFHGSIFPYKNDLIRQRRCNQSTKEDRHLHLIVVFYTADLSSSIKRLCNTTHFREKSQM
jgi:hypothetical protein